MENIYICGHKNPDTDSISSAVAYAYLKNKTDDSFSYIPVRCGTASDQTKFIFQKANAALPEFLKDIYPKVKDSMSKEIMTVRENDPISKILKYISEYNIRLTPVVDDDGLYKGMAGVGELTELFVRDDRYAKPIFTLRADSLKRSLKAQVINKGSLSEFNASIVVATMAYADFHRHVSAVGNEKSTILVIGNRKNILDEVFERDYPAIVIVGLKENDYSGLNLKGFKGWVFASPFDSAQTIRCIEMATPVKKLMSTPVPVTPEDYLEEVTTRISSTFTKSLPVVKDGKLEGIITGTDVLKHKKSKLIMVDHNELAQAIDGAEGAEIIEIIDHHRLGTVKTNTPVYFYSKPVGSTCTLVYELYKSNGVEIPKEIAVLLLGGMLSDTVILKSPTSTNIDKSAIAELSKYTGLDYKDFGIEIFSATNGLSTRPIKEILNTDYKIYDEMGIKFGVAQVETVTLNEVDDLKTKIIDELNSMAHASNMQWVMILITDIIKEESLLLTTNFPAGERMLAYKKISDNTFFLPGILSRKKQLLPELLRILEELKK